MTTPPFPAPLPAGALDARRTRRAQTLIHRRETARRAAALASLIVPPVVPR